MRVPILKGARGFILYLINLIQVLQGLFHFVSFVNRSVLIILLSFISNPKQ